jgi:outer membrane protein OmpA-like peptidoglycan-associated protein
MPSGITTKTAGGTTVFPTHRAGDAPFVRGGKGAKGHGNGVAELNLKRPPEEAIEEIHTKIPNLFIQQMGNRSLMGATVQFSETSSELDEWAKSRLKAISPMFLGKPHKIEIRGHAIRRPTTGAGVSDAWQLSYARCISTMKFLEEQGVEPERFRLSQAGAFEPYSQRSEAEWQGQNSRVDVYMIGEFVDDPKPTAKRAPPTSKTIDVRERGTADASSHDDKDASPPAHERSGG